MTNWVHNTLTVSPVTPEQHASLRKAIEEENLLGGVAEDPEVLTSGDPGTFSAKFLTGSDPTPKSYLEELSSEYSGSLVCVWYHDSALDRIGARVAKDGACEVHETNLTEVVSEESLMGAFLKDHGLTLPVNGETVSELENLGLADEWYDTFDAEASKAAKELVAPLVATLNS